MRNHSLRLGRLKLIDVDKMLAECLFSCLLLTAMVRVNSLRARVEDRYLVFVNSNGTIRSFPSYSYLYAAKQVHDLLIEANPELAKIESDLIDRFLKPLNMTSSANQTLNDTQSFLERISIQMFEDVSRIDNIMSSTQVKLPPSKPYSSKFGKWLKPFFTFPFPKITIIQPAPAPQIICPPPFSNHHRPPKPPRRPGHNGKRPSRPKSSGDDPHSDSGVDQPPPPPRGPPESPTLADRPPDLPPTAGPQAD